MKAATLDRCRMITSVNAVNGWAKVQKWGSPDWVNSMTQSDHSVRTPDFPITGRIILPFKNWLSKLSLQLPASLPPMPTPPLSHFHPLEPSLAPNLSMEMRDVLTNRADTWKWKVFDFWISRSLLPIAFENSGRQTNRSTRIQYALKPRARMTSLSSSEKGSICSAINRLVNLQLSAHFAYRYLGELCNGM